MAVIDVSKLLAPLNTAPMPYQSATPVIGGKDPIGWSEDLERVLSLPRRPPPNAEQQRALIAHMTAMLARPPGGPCRCRELGRKFCITELRGVQAWALYEAMVVGGVLGIIAVGAGKTLLGLLAPLVLPGCKQVLLLVPSNLVDQLVDDYHLIAQHFRVPSLVVQTPANPRGWTVPGAPTVHVLPYSRLSMPGMTDFLEKSIRPDTIIADEVDRLRNWDSAGTSRVVRWMDAHPETRFLAWTGSMTSKSLRDYLHIAAWVLKGASPLPLNDEVGDEWSEALDPVDWPRQGGALLNGYIAHGFMREGEHLRDGFRRRLHETPGVVYSTESPVSVELVIEEKPAPLIPPHVEEALEKVRAFERPDGEELLDALAVSKCAREIACGFYYRWEYPRHEPVPLILEWLAARKAWRKELRQRLKSRDEHLDSEHLCEQAAMRAWGDIPIQDHERHLPRWQALHWPAWRNIAEKVKPVTVAVRLSDYLVQDAAQWAHTNRGIVWYDNTEFGKWVAEVSGLPMHGGGNKAGERIGKERGHRSIIASLNSHGRGRNGLQFYFADQLVAEPPSDSAAWEQLLGRIHRPGQEAAAVRALYYAHTEELEKAYAQAFKRARYVEGTMGTEQKLIAGTRQRR